VPPWSYAKYWFTSMGTGSLSRRTACRPSLVVLRMLIAVGRRAHAARTVSPALDHLESALEAEVDARPRHRSGAAPPNPPSGRRKPRPAHCRRCWPRRASRCSRTTRHKRARRSPHSVARGSSPWNWPFFASNRSPGRWGRRVDSSRESRGSPAGRRDWSWGSRTITETVPFEARVHAAVGITPRPCST